MGLPPIPLTKNMTHEKLDELRLLKANCYDLLLEALNKESKWQVESKRRAAAYEEHNEIYEKAMAQMLCEVPLC